MMIKIIKGVLGLFIVFYIINNCYYWERQKELNESFVKAHQAASKAFEEQIKANHEIMRGLKNGSTNVT